MWRSLGEGFNQSHAWCPWWAVPEDKATIHRRDSTSLGRWRTSGLHSTGHTDPQCLSASWRGWEPSRCSVDTTECLNNPNLVRMNICFYFSSSFTRGSPSLWQKHWSWCSCWLKLQTVLSGVDLWVLYLWSPCRNSVCYKWMKWIVENICKWPNSIGLTHFRFLTRLQGSNVRIHS